jgi:hypothetical protein
VHPPGASIGLEYDGATWQFFPPPNVLKTLLLYPRFWITRIAAVLIRVPVDHDHIRSPPAYLDCSTDRQNGFTSRLDVELCVANKDGILHVGSDIQSLHDETGSSLLAITCALTNPDSLWPKRGERAARGRIENQVHSE